MYKFMPFKILCKNTGAMAENDEEKEEKKVFEDAPQDDEESDGSDGSGSEDDDEDDDAEQGPTLTDLLTGKYVNSAQLCIHTR